MTTSLQRNSDPYASYQIYYIKGTNTEISEKYAASIFMVKICWVRNRLFYICRLQGSWQFRHREEENGENKFFCPENGSKNFLRNAIHVQDYMSELKISQYDLS
jgi:hypothetical protein